MVLFPRLFFSFHACFSLSVLFLLFQYTLFFFHARFSLFTYVPLSPRFFFSFHTLFLLVFCTSLSNSFSGFYSITFSYCIVHFSHVIDFLFTFFFLEQYPRTPRERSTTSAKKNLLNYPYAISSDPPLSVPILRCVFLPFI